MLKRRTLFVFAVVLVAILALTACAAPGGAPAGGGGEQQAATGGGEEAAPAQREIVWMVRTSTTENPWEQDVVIPAFEAEHPDIKVNLLIIDQPDIAVKREAMIAAGEPLHVWSTNWGGDGFASDRFRGLIMDLTPLIERDNVDLSVFIPEVLAIYNNEGKQWGLPFLTTGSYVFYNMDLFDEAGIEYPPTDWEDKSWTWDRMLDLAKQLTKNYDDPVNATYGWIQNRQNIEGPAMIFGQFPWPEGAYETGFADHITLNTPEIIDAYQKHHDLIWVHKVQPDAAASEALSQLGGTFESGRVAMMENGGWGWWVYSRVTPDVEGGFCWGVAPLPWGTPDAETRAVIYTDPWVITRGLEGQELEDAWTFVKFLIREDNARAYMKATNTPPTQFKLQEEWFQQFECMAPEKVKEVYQGAFAHGLESSNHLMVRWDELNQIWGNELGAWINDPEADTAAVMAQLEEDLTAALQRIKEEEGGQ
ncbi:MAG: extracellular solute-binding protein [Caldilineae bacterium]|nr:MAG: extracellular solute-binding protein [Caldilineae bacterium]